MSANKMDQITLDIIKDSIQAAGEEMFISIARSSKSPVIYEVLDFASAITDVNGQLLTQGNGITGFIGMLSDMVKEVLKKFNDTGKMQQGDIFISNDPYSGGGSHLSDVGLVMPIYYDGDLVGMSVAKAHWTEVGGKEMGSWSVDAKEVYQEGIQFPNLRLATAGEVDQNMIDLITANVRFPEQSLGDMWSQIAGLRTAERRIMEICDKFGKETYLMAVDKMLSSSAEEARKKLLAMPQGSRKAQAIIEDDGMGTENINIEVEVTIKDGKFIVDFTGTHPQVSGPINLPYSVLVSACRTAMLVATDLGDEINDGVFDALEIIAERGSIVNAERPASVSICWETLLPSIDAISHALIGVLPDRFVASNACTVGSFILAVKHPETGKDQINVAPTLQGLGAGIGMDGQSAQFSYGNGETYNIPVEVLESRYGFFVESYELNTGLDAGGGQWRGGAGLKRRYRMRADGNVFMGAYGHFRLNPWGYDGGQDGSNSFFQIERADGTLDPKRGKGAQIPLNKGDTLIVITSIGGGCGDPHKRPAEQVAMDVKNEYITPEIAEKTYGVLVSEDGELLGEVEGR